MSAPTRDLVQALGMRGLVHQVTDDALGPLSVKEPITAYIGFDPTAPSLHAGSLYPVMLLAHLAKAGHRPIAVMGGGTGLIGDPTGVEKERPLLGPDEIAAHVAGIESQVRRIFANAGAAVDFANNAEWLTDVRLVEFLRDIGKHFTVNWMMAKDSVRARLEDRDHGISFTEFSYMLLQAYDFLRLHETRGCRLQMGGSDQWGNITAGVELIRKRAGGSAFGLTSPLLLTPEGKKFGKSAGNAVWLDPDMTSPYRFFQFWMNQEDASASSLLAPYTFLPMDEVAAIRAEAATAPEKRIAQHRLAREVTGFVHGKEAADRAEKTARFLFGQVEIRDLDEAALAALTGEVATVEASAPPAAAAAFHDAGLVKSASEFKRLHAQGAIYVNNVALPKGADPKAPLKSSDLLFGKFLVLRRGKKDYALVRISGR